MGGHGEALEFLKYSQFDPKLSKEILEAIRKGGIVTQEAVLHIAAKAGYTFTKEEFEVAVRSSIVDRYRAGEQGLASIVNANDPPESSCAKGCLSYTRTWHPDDVFGGRGSDPSK